jgi:hypothetical protein
MAFHKYNTTNPDGSLRSETDAEQRASLMRYIETPMPKTIHIDYYEPTPETFGKDHWSTLVYIEDRCTHGGFYQIASDARMRTCRRNWRIANTKPTGGKIDPRQVISDNERYPTRLASGDLVTHHDDWECLVDLCTTGYLQVKGGGEPDVKKKVHLTALGQAKVNELRAARGERARALELQGA